MVTIVRNPITYLAPKIGTLILMIFALWYFTSDRTCSHSSDQNDGIPIISTNACLYIMKKHAIVKPCLLGDTAITKRKIIDGEFYKHGKPSTLIISVPSEIMFTQIYDTIVFSGYARDYHFPDIQHDIEYVLFRRFDAYVGGLSVSYIRNCKYFGHFNYQESEFTQNKYIPNCCVIE